MTGGCHTKNAGDAPAVVLMFTMISDARAVRSYLSILNAGTEPL